MTDQELDSEKEAKLDKVKQTVVNFIVPLIAFIFAALIGVFVILPSIRNKQALTMELQQATSLENTLRSKEANLNRLIDFKSVVDENSDLVNKVLVSEEQVPALLTQIDKIARDSGLAVTKLSYSLGSTATGETAAQITYDYVTINLGIDGSFNQLVTFLTTVENAARLIDVVNIRYAHAETETGPQISASVVLISPYLFVQSTAVTDEPVDLNISDPKFLDLINKIKSLRYYDPTIIDASVPVVEATPEEEEASPQEETPAETPEDNEPSIFGN